MIHKKSNKIWLTRKWKGRGKELRWRCIASVAGGIVATATHQYALILSCVIIAIIFDVVTGLIKSKVKEKPWSSRRGMIGFWKKISLLVALFFGMFLDFFIPVALAAVNAELPYGCPFGLTIGVYITLNESISICENLYAINPMTLPKWIVNLMRKTSDKIDDGGDSKDKK